MQKTRAPIQILALADRALGPALKRFGLNPLIERRISDVLDPAARKSLTEFFDHSPESLPWWFELLLGPEGEASRQLRLTR